jgi:hypothetical protein
MPRDRRKKQRRSTENTVLRESRRQTNRRQSSDRRVARRVEVDLWIEQELGKEVNFRHAADLSIGGVRLDQGISYPVGTQVRLVFRFPGEPSPLSLAAEIVGVTTADGGGYTNIKFVGLAREEKLRLNGFLDSVTERVIR